MIEKAPMSCRMSSAAMVSLRMRLSAKATSSGIDGDEVMADHQHVEMLVDGVDRVGPRRVGRGRQHVGRPQTLMMSGAWPPPAPSVWKAWIVRPLKAAMVSSTKPLSFSVSVWIITCTSCSSATRGSCRWPPGVVPQSSCSFSAQAPASICSTSAAGSAGVALAGEAEVHREGVEAPRACARQMCQGPGVQVVASVPCAGPVPPPSMVVTPAHQRLLDLLRADEMDMRVDAAGGEDLALAGDRLGAGADDDVDARLVSGLPALPMATIAVLQADIGLDDAPVVDDQRIGDDGVDRALGARAWLWPMPSRITLPPPNFTSSP
jgi:hypothetical protein